MQIKIKNNTLMIQIDGSAENIEKIVSFKPSNNSQGAIYVNKDYVGRNCLFVLLDPSITNSIKKSFSYNGEMIDYYDMIIREIKSVKTSKEYFVGRAYLPSEWIGKKVLGVVLLP